MADSLHSRSRRLRLETLEPRLPLDASSLRITEFLASNDDTLVDFEGDSSDWLEIYNPSQATVDLAGLYLTDDSDELEKWEFPQGSEIEPGEFLVVFASDKDLVAPNDELHTNFKISAGGEYLALVDVDGLTVIDEFAPEFPEQVEDVSYGLSMNTVAEAIVTEGTSARAWVPTSSVYDATWTDVSFDDRVFNISGPSGFGYENSPGNFPNFVGQFNTEVPSGTGGLYVRVPFDVESLTGVGQLALLMKYDDGFVAYLNGVEIASANRPANPDWNSTATSTHDDFEAIEYQIFDVSDAVPALIEGDNVLSIHALNFSAGSSDFLVVPELYLLRSEIIAPEEIGYLEFPTPGFGNSQSFAGFADEPTFSVPHGFYDSPQQVEISSTTSGATIVYTTDGSTPTVDANLNPINGQVYTGPINVSSTTTLRAITFKQDFRPSFVQASSYLFLDDVITQSPNGEAPADWPNFNVNGQLLDYGIDPEIVSLYGEQAVKDSLASLPAVMLTTDAENLFDPATGIYVNALNRGREWERPASVEFITNDQTEGFSTNAGLRIRGGYHRNDFNPKHAFRLYFRSEYGDGILDYPLHGEEASDRFDVLDLRTAQNYSWAAWGDSINGYQNSYLREVYARDTQADLGHPHTRSRYVHLYLNGQYWGLFMTQERVQEQYGEAYFGGSEEDYDVVKSDPFESGGTEIADGNDIAWRQLFDLAQDLADNPISSADNYWTMQGLNPDGTRNESLPVLLDVDNLIDYMMIIFSTGGHDTGISAFFGNQRANNWFGIRNRETGDQGFQFFLHDNEHSLAAGELAGSLHGTLDIDRTGPFGGDLYDVYEFTNPAFLHQDLLAHPEYVQRFIDHAQALLFNGGTLAPRTNVERMLERYLEVEPAIIAESARWGDAKKSSPYTKADWATEALWLLSTYFNARGAIFTDQLRGAGLYPDFAAPVLSQHGGTVFEDFQLEMSASAGVLYYTTDGVTDPRAIGGAVNNDPAVQTYSGAFTLSGDATVKARLLTPEGEWSGLVEADFNVLPFLQGDYDRNDTVNGADFLEWQRSYGTTVASAYDGADGDGDTQVDDADLDAWAAHYGEPLVASAALQSSADTQVTLSDSVLESAALADVALAWNLANQSSDEQEFVLDEASGASVPAIDAVLATEILPLVSTEETEATLSEIVAEETSGELPWLDEELVGRVLE